MFKFIVHRSKDYLPDTASIIFRANRYNLTLTFSDLNTHPDMLKEKTSPFIKVHASIASASSYPVP